MDWRDLRWALPSVLNMLEGGLFPHYDGVAHVHSASDGIRTHQWSERAFAARSRDHSVFPTQAQLCYDGPPFANFSANQLIEVGRRPDADNHASIA